MCKKFGLCMASRNEGKFLELVKVGPSQFTEDLFSEEGLVAGGDAALTLEVQAHIIAAFQRWEIVE